MLLDELSIPIVQAPMAGGPSTPDLAVAVSEAGGLGFLAGGYLAAEALRSEIREVRERTLCPFAVNVFVPGDEAVDEEALRAYLKRLSPDARRYGVELGEARYSDEQWDEKLVVLAAERPAAVSFTFGCPPRHVVRSLQARGISVWVTVTSPVEAHTAAENGADALVVQGTEAGGHSASFRDDDREPYSLLSLLRLIAAERQLPLIAAGGIADAPGLAAVLAAGAAAAQIGSAFMLAPEAGTHPAHRAALSTSAPTALTRAFSGRRARGIVNRFQAVHSSHAPCAYPHIHYATSPLRAEARQAGDAQAFNLWAGQTHRLAESRPAGEIVRQLAADAREAAGAVLARLDQCAATDARTDASPTS